LVYGTVLVSEKNLPIINETFISGLSDLGAAILPWDPEQDSILVSFSDPGLHFIDDHYTTLRNVVVEGQVIIESRDSMYIAASAILKNVILKSPVVYVEDGFTGTLQIFASEKIILGENVHLLYPSVLGLEEQLFPEEECAQISIASRSQVIGSVFLFSRNENFRFPVQLNISSGAAIDGFVYCKGETQLRGTVNGHLYTEKFYLETKSSGYENHLLDATIQNRLPADFVYIGLLNNDEKLSRIEWLN
jgi:hypothetical protein